MAKILNKVAIAAGAGLGIGLTAIAAPPARRTMPGVPEPESTTAGNILDLEPLLDRIEVLERRLDVALSAADTTDTITDSAAITAREPKLDSELKEIRAQILSRMDLIEQTLAEHSAAIKELRNQEALTDETLQRLINAVERLVERGSAPVAAPVPANASFHDHLNEAMAPPRRRGIFGL